MNPSSATRRSGSCLLSVFTIAAVLFATVSCEIAIGDIEKMPIRALRKALLRRGIVCEDCLEKEHFVSKLREAVEAGVQEVSETEMENLEKQQQRRAKPGGGGGGRAARGAGDGEASGTGGTPGGAFTPDFETMKAFKKKVREEEAMQEALRRAGYGGQFAGTGSFGADGRPSGLNFNGGGGSGGGNNFMKKMVEDWERKNGPIDLGDEDPMKDMGGPRNVRRNAKRRRTPTRPSSASKDDGREGGRRSSTAAKEEEDDDVIEL